mgnify:CR=1 FL=1
MHRMEQSHTHLIPNRSSKNPTHSMILFVERRVCNGLSKIILILPSLTVKSASNVPSLCFGFSFASTQSQASVPQKQNMHLFCCWWSAFSPHSFFSFNNQQRMAFNNWLSTFFSFYSIELHQLSPFTDDKTLFTVSLYSLCVLCASLTFFTKEQ